MAQNITIAAFVFGAILVLIALLGGNFKIFGAEISGTAGRTGRFIAGVGGLLLIAIGLFGALQPPPSPSPAPRQPVTRPVPTPSPAPQQPVTRPAPSPATSPVPGPTTTRPPELPPYDPYRAFMSGAVSPGARNPLADPRVREAIRLTLQGNDIGSAKRLMAEAGYPNGFSLNLLMSRFAKAGGSEGEALVLSGKLATIGVRVVKVP